jgi:hypothetical protein
MSYSDWIDALTKYQDGRIWRNNFEFDSHTGNIDAVTEDEFRIGIDSLMFSVDPADTEDMISRKVSAVFDAVIAANPTGFDLVGTREPSYRAFSNVKSLRAAIDRNIDIHRVGVPIDDTDMLAVWRLINVLITPAHLVGELRTARNFFWATKTSTLETIKSTVGADTAACAKVVRERLGLAKFDAGWPMLEIIVPPGAIVRRVKRKAPTCFDAGLPNSVWVPSLDPDGFGWTLDLSGGGNGCEEVVIEGLPLDDTFAMDKIGILPLAGLAVSSLDDLEDASLTRLAGL